MNEKIVALSIGNKYLTATMSKNEYGESKIIASAIVESKGVRRGIRITYELYRRSYRRIKKSY